LEREFSFFNVLEGGVCTMCAPRDQRKSSDNQREYAETSVLASADGCVERRDLFGKPAIVGAGLAEAQFTERAIVERPLLAAGSTGQRNTLIF
jgi:hypothetical protein